MKRFAWILCLPILLRAESMRANEEPSPEARPVVRAMNDELHRAMEQLRLPDAPKPYYIGMRFNDVTYASVAASFGAIVHKQSSRARLLHVRVRVGDYALDNSGGASDFTRAGVEQLPTDDDYDTFRHDIWYATDESYKAAAAAYARKMAMRQTQTASSEDVADFSHEPPVRVVDHRRGSPIDVERAAALVRQLSAVAREFPGVNTSEVTFSAANGLQTFVSSEGTLTDESGAVFSVVASFHTQAPDGMPLGRSVFYCANTFDELPAADAMTAELRAAAKELSERRNASEADDYVGPVLFEASAAAQLAREVLAPQLSGAPAPKWTPQGTPGMETQLAGKLGQRILPVGFSVVDDPGLAHLAGAALIGGSSADDEGVPARRVEVVGDGVLESFLMSRSPRKGFEHSNGHARDSYVGGVRPGFSNLVLSVKHGLTAAELRRRLLAEAHAAHQPYALVVRQLEEGGAIMGRGGESPLPSPVVLVKVTPDGKEEPLRGATFGPFALSALEDVLAAGDEVAVNSRVMPTPTSVAAPALLFKRVEIKKPTGSRRKPPVLAHPYFAQEQP